MYDPSRPELKHPDEYEGEPVCLRCGRTPEGYYYLSCDTPGIKHDGSCTQYKYTTDICEVCKNEWEED